MHGFLGNVKPLIQAGVTLLLPGPVSANLNPWGKQEVCPRDSTLALQPLGMELPSGNSRIDRKMPIRHGPLNTFRISD